MMPISRERNKPLIIVTGPDKRLRFGWWATRFMLFLAGLNGVYVTPRKRKFPHEADGVIIGGGDDIEPEHYGDTGDAGATYDKERDELEMAVVRKALTCKIPILGICRGAQLINVVLGGTLHTDIRPQRKLTPNKNSLFPIKWADIVDDSRLIRILGKNPVKINSLHNQAINKVASILNVAARDRDGFVQAVESRRENFILGVQWHPEYLPFSSSQRRLFRAFAYEVKATQAIISKRALETINTTH